MLYSSPCWPVMIRLLLPSRDVGEESKFRPKNNHSQINTRSKRGKVKDYPSFLGQEIPGELAVRASCWSPQLCSKTSVHRQASGTANTGVKGVPSAEDFI